VLGKAASMSGVLAGAYDSEPLDEGRCVRMLSQASLGRVVLSVGCLPAAVPVHVDVVHGHVLLTCLPGPVLTAAARHDVISVETDGEDADGATWCVLATGVARLVEGDDPLRDVARADRLGRMLDRGASLVAVPLTTMRGERTWWTPSL
jgi:uncharacterized protein